MGVGQVNVVKRTRTSEGEFVRWKIQIFKYSGRQIW